MIFSRNGKFVILSLVDLVIKNAKIFSSKGYYEGGVAVSEGKIVAVGSSTTLPAA